jgi:23S rRNA pseudouridine2605 synthase
MDAPAPERLLKVLARAGLGSRRTADAWIAAGRVQVDGVVAAPGTRVGPGARITLDGQPVQLAPARPARLLLYHKPEGEISTRADPQGRPTVFERLPRLRGARWVGVGRLDVNTSGLLLFTDDGALAQRLMHPRSGFEREYAVRVRGEVGEDVLARLRAGVELDDGPARALRVEPAGGTGHNRWLRMVVTQGRQRIVRRMWESLGFEVSRLIRVRYGPIALPRDLPRGRARSATESERAALGLAPAQRTRPAAARTKPSAGPRVRRLERPPRRG